MFESFIIMVREGVEAALVIGILLVMVRRAGRHDLERSVFWGLACAVLASVGAAVALHSLPVNEEAYEGTLYAVSAVFVASMMWWMHRNSKSLRADIEQRVGQAVTAQPGRRRKEAWALGAFAFLMVFREGAETVMFLSAVNLTTDALLSFIGTVLGLAVAVVFAVMFMRGSLRVDLRRFFWVTECVLAIFIAQLAINAYHEFSEAGLLPATQQSMALIGPVVRHNSLFVLAIVAVPLFLWLSRSDRAREQATAGGVGTAAQRLAVAQARREHFYRKGAVAITLLVLAVVGVVCAREIAPKKVPPPEMVTAENGWIKLPLSRLEDGKLLRLGLPIGDRLVRFLAIKTADGKIRTGLDACEICGPFGYVQEDRSLICVNCAAEINPVTVGVPGGCNPIPLAAEITATEVRIAVNLLEKEAKRFPATAQIGLTEVDPVCGMQVRVNEAAAFESHQGKIYYFCNPHCRDLFHKDPTIKLPMK